MKNLSVPLSLLLAAPLLAASASPYRIESPSGHTLEPAQLAGKAVLLWYEGPKTVELNDDAKAQLQVVLRALPADRRVELVAVGDVSGYDYWPARAFAKKKLAEYERKYGHPIYGDWRGQMRRSLGLPERESNLLFIDETGEVRLHAIGKVSQADVERAKALLRGAR